MMREKISARLLPVISIILLNLFACSDSSVRQIPVPPGISAPPDMVYIPEGDFIMGDAEDVRTLKGHKVSRKAFLIDRYEVTRKQYKEFKPGYEFHPKKAEFPIADVNHADAEAYCKWKNRRLPTEAEWEKAARGTDGRKWPWLVYHTHPNDGFSGFLPEEVGKRKEWVSPYGVFGMGYNVWEWVDDWYAYDNMPATDAQKFKVIRGGVLQTHLNVGFSPAWFRNYMNPGAEYNFLGFRCAADVEQKTATQ